MLRLREAGSEQLAARRREESEEHRQHLPALSELLLIRWRAGDWGVEPEQLLEQIGGRREREPAVDDDGLAADLSKYGSTSWRHSVKKPRSATDE